MLDGLEEIYEKHKSLGEGLKIEVYFFHLIATDEGL